MVVIVPGHLLLVVVVQGGQVMLRGRRQSAGPARSLMVVGGRQMGQVVVSLHQAQIPRARTGRPALATAAVDAVRAATSPSIIASAILVLVVVVVLGLAAGQDVGYHEP